jgi:hypothetical protein
MRLPLLRPEPRERPSALGGQGPPPRGSHPVAETGPAHRRTGASLRAALADVPPPDDAFSRDIASAIALLDSEVGDPWADA